MQPIESFKYFGLLAFVILIIGLAFVVIKWPQNNHLTFSQHIAKQRSSILYYIGLFSVTLPLLLSFFIFWFMPTFDVSIWFAVFLVVSSAAQYACTFIPETSGWKVKYHRLLSGISGICLIPLLVILLFTPTTTTVDKFAIISGLATIAGVLYVVMSNKKEQYEPSYIHQTVYYLGFFAPILFISYL